MQLAGQGIPMTSARERLAFRGVVHPWMCDAMGHMNVRHYTGLFDDCVWHVLGFLLPQTQSGAGTGWVAATMTMTFVQEVAPRTMLILLPNVMRIGSKSIASRVEMRDATSDVHYATGEFVSVLFDLKSRTSCALTADVRSRAAQLLVDD
jgi:acyl-CoA thioester hydrolase